MHTSLILSGLRKSKQIWWPWWRSTLHRVVREHGGFIDGGQHVFCQCWETWRIAATFLHNGTMNGHSILGWIPRFPDGWGMHFCQCLPTNLRSLPNLTKTTHQERCSFLNREIKMHSPVQPLHNRRCYFVLFLAQFVIWSGGYPSTLRIMWIYSTCMQKWAMMKARKCSWNSRIHEIPRDS